MKDKKREKLLIGVIGLFLLLTVMPGAAYAVVVPQMINYQGFLTDDTGAPVDGTRDMIFRISVLSSGGGIRWQENHLAASGRAVTVSKGIFSVILGSYTPLTYGHLNNDESWLGVQVYNPDTALWEQLLPRQQLTSVAYSIHADRLDGLDSTAFIQTETDPTITDPSIKDGVSWAEVGSKPAGFADNTDDGITSETDPTITDPSIKDGVSWAEVGSKPAGFADNTDDGILSETDPQVGTNTNNYVPRWNGSALVTGSIFDNGSNVGIGTVASSFSKLHVRDNTTSSLRLMIDNQNTVGNESIIFGEDINNVGITAWGPTSSFPGAFTFFNNDTSGHYIWVTDSQVKMTLLNNGDLGIGTETPASKLHIKGSAHAILKIETDSIGHNAALILDRGNNVRVASIEHLTNGVGNWYTGILYNGGSLTNDYTISTNSNISAFPDDARLTIRASDGYVGIGTRSPASKLDVDGDIKATGTVEADQGVKFPGTNVTYYHEQANSSTQVFKDIGQHSFCALGMVKFQHSSGGGTNKYCRVSPEGDGSWTLEVRSEGGNNMACEVYCF
jgi:hypothetical protein